ncbi:MAG: 30S ribosomal protein S17 [Leptotrichiaceae bacterium]|nr:30S ribosomal protein S17 [Leptotrichiaceae bacterium]
MEKNERRVRKVREGIVVSDKMDKTVVVLEETMKLHKLYKKRVKTSKKYKAHDENNECVIGDKVQIMETRPMSKDKRWRIVTILEKAK